MGVVATSEDLLLTMLEVLERIESRLAGGAPLVAGGPGFDASAVEGLVRQLARSMAVELAASLRTLNLPAPQVTVAAAPAPVVNVPRAQINMPAPIVEVASTDLTPVAALLDGLADELVALRRAIGNIEVTAGAVVPDENPVWGPLLERLGEIAEKIESRQTTVYAAGGGGSSSFRGQLKDAAGNIINPATEETIQAVLDYFEGIVTEPGATEETLSSILTQLQGLTVSTQLDNSLVGQWSYLSGTSGTIEVPEGYRVVGLVCHVPTSGDGALVMGDTGSTIPLPAGTQFSVSPNGQIAGPFEITFTGTDSYFVELVGGGPLGTDSTFGTVGTVMGGATSTFGSL